MTTVNAANTDMELYHLIDNLSNEPIFIKGKKNNAVLISEEEWKSIEETLYLLSIPGMRESLLEGKAAPLEECSDEPGW